MALKADLLVELRKISDRNLTITQDRWGISVTHPERIMGIYEGNYGYLIEFGMALHLSPDPAVDRETEVKTNAEVIELVLAWFPC